MEKPNIILLVIDTLRYDYAMDDPFFVELAERGVSFDRMYAPSTFTNSNMSSVRSGMYPPRHGWRSWPGARPIKENIKMLEDFLIEADYWLVNGIDMPMVLGETQEFINNEEMFRSLTHQEPFFLYSHCMNIHDEYFARGHMHYKEYIPAARGFIENAFIHAERQDFTNEILWIIMSDHGIGLKEDQLSGEGGDVGAGQIYDFRNRIYCVLIGSNIEPKFLTDAYSMIDLLPSILDYCEIQPTIPDGFLKMQGISVFEESDPLRYVYLEAQSPYSIWPSKEPNVFGATDGEFKLMITPDGNRLYNLIVDPEERNNLLSFVDTQSMLEFIQETNESD